MQDSVISTDLFKQMDFVVGTNNKPEAPVDAVTVDVSPQSGGGYLNALTRVCRQDYPVVPWIIQGFTLLVAQRQRKKIDLLSRLVHRRPDFY